MKQISIPFWTLLNAGYITVGPEWNYRLVCSPFTRLYYVTDGKAYIEYSNRTVILEPGRFYIVPAFTMHGTRCPKSMTHYYIHVYEEVIDNSGSPMTDMFLFPDSLEPDSIIAQIFQEVLSRNEGLALQEKNPYYYDNHANLRAQIGSNSSRPLAERMINNGMVNVLMGYWLKDAVERRQIHNSRIAEVVDYINRHLFENFSVADCAAAVSMSRYHLLRQFKASIGTSLMHYVLFLRLRRAQTELIVTSKSIKEIASSLGYEDINYFTRLFHKHIGQTPGAYRRNNKM